MRTIIVASLALKFFLLYFAVFVVVFYFRYSAHTPARLSFKTHRLRLCNAGRAKSKSAAHTGAQPLQSLSIFESLLKIFASCYFVLIAFPDDNRQRYYCFIAESEIKEWVKSKT